MTGHHILGNSTKVFTDYCNYAVAYLPGILIAIILIVAIILLVDLNF